MPNTPPKHRICPILRPSQAEDVVAYISTLKLEEDLRLCVDRVIQLDRDDEKVRLSNYYH
eukprot:580072-Prorocentrum_minimum.AAC.1